MKLLSIESASLVASAALTEDRVLLAECTSNYKKTHSETLLPMISQVLEMTDTDPASLDAVAVSSGPGSFTGLRIGAATAKGLAFALGIPVIGVPETDAMAYACYGSSFVICPIMDARRDQVYSGLYEFRGEDFVVLQPAEALALTGQLDRARETALRLQKPLLFVGDGLKTYEGRIREILGKEAHFAPAHMKIQRATCIGALGYERYLKQEYVSAEAFLPFYLRKSQAEREREAMGLPLEGEV